MQIISGALRCNFIFDQELKPCQLPGMHKYFLIFSFLIPLQSLAAEIFTINGHILKYPNKTYIQTTSPNKKYEIITKSQEIISIIDRLSDNDFVSTSGEIRNNRLHAEAINLIGLSNLIGSWKNETQLYNFKNYTDLQVFNFNYTKSNAPQVKKINYKYSLAPNEADGGWVMFLSSRNNHNLFTMFKLTDSTLEIFIFDSNTGAQLDHQVLTKFYPYLKY